MRSAARERNEGLVRRIHDSIRMDKVSHAYLCEGPAYVDKPAFAKYFAKAILCPEKREVDCGSCPICSKIDHDNHEDLIYVCRLPGKQTIGIEQIRHMQEQIAIKPNGPRYIVIAEESERMTEAAQNCLLKTLEEPPGKTVLILTAENGEQLLPTIRSRCIRYRLEGMDQPGDEDMISCARLLTRQLLEGAPYYRMRAGVTNLFRDRDQTLELIDRMQAECRERLLTRNDRGIMESPAQIGRLVSGLEEARGQIGRGLSPAYTMKRLMLRF